MISSGSYNVADAEHSQHTFYVNSIVCNVWLLDSTCVAFKVDKQCRGQVLLDLTFDYLELLERDFFGLVYNGRQSRDATILKWLDPSKQVRKQASGHPPFTFWFRVKFYVPDPVCLHEEYTRYQFFLQIRKDILEGRLPVNKSTATQLAGLALQSELGDFNTNDFHPGYVSHFRFLQQQNPEFELQASEWHRKSSSMLPSAAELEFLNIARSLERYGVKTQEACDIKDQMSSILLGVSFAGITVFRGSKSTLQFPWENIVNIRFASKKFTIQLKSPVVTILPSSGSTVALSRAPSTSTFAGSQFGASPTDSLRTFRLPSVAMAKSFWQYAVACHAFFRVREPMDTGTMPFGRVPIRGSNGTTSISATALHAAISRVTSGFRRYFSLGRHSGFAKTGPGGPVGGVERTLSTVMELRRNAHAFDRSRSVSRRSIRHSAMTSTVGLSFAQSSGLRTTSNLSLTNDRSPTDAMLGNVPVKSYAQVPPGVRVGPAMGPVSNSIGPSSVRPPSIANSLSPHETTGIPLPSKQSTHVPVAAARMKKSPSPTTHEPPLGSQTKIPQSELPTQPPGSRNSFREGAQLARLDKQTTSRLSKFNIPTGKTTRGSSKRLRNVSPAAPNQVEGISPKSTHRSLESRGKPKAAVTDTTPDGDTLHPPSDGSDRSEREFDREEALRYWHARRAQSAARPARISSKSRSNSTQLHGSYHGRVDAEAKQDHTASVSGSRRSRDFTVMEEPIMGNGGSMRQTGSRTSVFHSQTSSSQKRPSEGAVVIRKEPTETCDARSSTSLHIKSTTNSAGPNFVRDPFHPGAPGGDPRDYATAGLTGGDPNDGLVRIYIRPDSHGRFGFNVRGGVDFGTPIIVSRVGQNMPADLCIPRLAEGDQLVSINGRNVSGHTHAEVISFIRSVRDETGSVLELLVKPGDYVTDDFNDDITVPDSGDAPPLPPRASQASSQQSTSFSILDRFPVNNRRQSTKSAKRESSLSQLYGFDTNLNPLLASMIDLEHSLEDESILHQFEQLPRRKPGFTMNASRLNENILKNRYRDISPYDQTRVILRHGTGDYINASFVSMDFPKAGFAVNYIAAQGPLPSTYGDFWQMCWEQRVSVVVMLTAVSERGRMKCHQYWPELGQTLRFSASGPTKSASSSRGAADVQVHTTREEVTGDFAFRDLTLTQVVVSSQRTNVESRRVTQLQYITWPDHGVPNNPDDLISFVEHVRVKRGKNSAPIVVHCSAGIGRTGVLITLETALNLMERGQPVRPIDLVQLMRSQRALLIQTTSQFQFVCETILKVFQRDYVDRMLN